MTDELEHPRVCGCGVQKHRCQGGLLRLCHWKVPNGTHGGATVTAVPSGETASRSLTQGKGHRGESGARCGRETLADLLADLVAFPARDLVYAGDDDWRLGRWRGDDDVRTRVRVLRVVREPPAVRPRRDRARIGRAGPGRRRATVDRNLRRRRQRRGRRARARLPRALHPTRLLQRHHRAGRHARQHRERAERGGHADRGRPRQAAGAALRPQRAAPIATVATRTSQAKRTRRSTRRQRRAATHTQRIIA